MVDHQLEQLEIYTLSKQLSQNCRLHHQQRNIFARKLLWDQFIRSIDSVGANIAEGYGRYHYMDSVKFYYIARGSLSEAKHRLHLLYERKIISREVLFQLLRIIDRLRVKLNHFIEYVKEREKKVVKS